MNWFVAFATLAGFVLGGVAGWLLAWDPLGETARLWLVFGGGGALSGLVVSLYSRQRLSPALGGRYARLLTVLLGAPTLVAAVYLARYVFIFAAGAEPLWPALLTLVILVAGAALGAVVVIVPIALFLSATLTRSRPQPSGWRRRVTTEWFGSAIVLAFMGYMPEDGYRSLWFMLQEPRRSTWYDARQELFSDVLSGSRCDILVVPTEAGPRSVDRIGRDAITFMLAARVADRTGLCVTDPDLARRALGEHRRRFEDSAVEALAKRVDAKWILRTEANLTRDGQAFTLSLRTTARDASGQWAPATETRWQRLPWSDESPPEQAAWRELAPAVAKLPIPARSPATAAVPAPKARSGVPPDPTGLAVDTGDARERAERLQLLAAYTPQNMPEARALWLRSIVALRNADSNDPEVRMRSARAWLALGRRLVAESLVTPIETPEARSVLALSQGDLPGSMEAATSVTSPWSALIDRIALERLRWWYNQNAGAEDRRTELLSAMPRYKAFFHHELGTEDWDHGEAAALVAEELAHLGVSDSLVNARTYVLRALTRIPWLAWVRRLYPNQAGSTELLFEPAWRTHAEEWRRESIDRVSRRDLVEVLFAINRSAAFGDLATRLTKQGLPDAGLTEVSALEPALRRHPAILSQYTVAASQAGGPDAGWFDSLHRGAAFEIARKQLAFEDAYSPIGEYLADKHNIAIDWRDEPEAPAQLVARANGLWRHSETREEAKRLYVRAGNTSTVRFEYLRHATELSPEEDRERARAEMLAGLGTRFRGHPSRTSLENMVVDGWDDPARELAFLQQQMDTGANDWRTRTHAASVLLRMRRPHDARRMLEEWLTGHQQTENTVVLSNYAGEAAAMFWEAGEVALGRLFAEWSDGYQSGSWRAIRTARLLAVFDQDWNAAARVERRLYDRYDDFNGLAIAIWFEQIMGKSDVDADLRTALREDRTGWPARIQAARLRMAGGDAAATRKAIEAWRFPEVDAETQEWMRSWLAIESLTVDRVPSTEDLELIRNASGSTAQVHASIARGRAAQRSGDPEAALRLLRPVYPSSRSEEAISQMWGYALPPLVSALVKSGRLDEVRQLLDDRRHVGYVDSHYYLGKALVAHAQGQQEQAVQALWEAFVDVPAFGSMPMPPHYLVHETAEDLYLQSQEKRYLALLQDLAVRSARTWPTSWAYAFIAKYAEEPSVRTEAAAVALYLDPKSVRLASVPAANLEDARALLQKRNPLLEKRR
jgi:hypothetical protein